VKITKSIQQFLDNLINFWSFTNPLSDIHKLMKTFENFVHLKNLQKFCKNLIFGFS